MRARSSRAPHCTFNVSLAGQGGSQRHRRSDHARTLSVLKRWSACWVPRRLPELLAHAKVPDCHANLLDPLLRESERLVNRDPGWPSVTTRRRLAIDGESMCLPESIQVSNTLEPQYLWRGPGHSCLVSSIPSSRAGSRRLGAISGSANRADGSRQSEAVMSETQVGVPLLMRRVYQRQIPDSVAFPSQRQTSNRETKARYGGVNSLDAAAKTIDHDLGFRHRPLAPRWRPKARVYWPSQAKSTGNRRPARGEGAKRLRAAEQQSGPRHVRGFQQPR